MFIQTSNIPSIQNIMKIYLLNNRHEITTNLTRVTICWYSIIEVKFRTRKVSRSNLRSCRRLLAPIIFVWEIWDWELNGCFWPNWLETLSFYRFPLRKYIRISPLYCFECIWNNSFGHISPYTGLCLIRKMGFGCFKILLKMKTMCCNWLKGCNRLKSWWENTFSLSVWASELEVLGVCGKWIIGSCSIRTDVMRQFSTGEHWKSTCWFAYIEQ